MLCINCNKSRKAKGRDVCNKCWRKEQKMAPYRKKQDLINTTIEKFLVGHNIYNFSSDKKIPGKKDVRPDLRFNYLGVEIIIEVDEDQHKSYNKDDERRRIKAMKKQFPKLIMLRINPDKYQNYLPMIEDKTKDYNGNEQNKDLKYHWGEIQRRQNIIITTLEHLMIEIRTDLLLGSPIVFKEHKLFFG